VGERHPTHEGEVLFREGDQYDFCVVLDGLVEVVTGSGEDERRIAVHGPGRFLGELNLLIGGAALMSAIVREPGEVLVVPAERLREMVSADPALGDLILRAYLARRSLLIGLGAGAKIVGSHYSPEARRLREFLARNRVPHNWIDLEEDAQAEAMLRELGVPPEETPVVVWNEQVLRNPSNAEVAGLLGLSPATSETDLCDLIVVGGGPAGLAAAVYGASEGLATVVLESVAVGGQAGTSSLIENYVGFPSGIPGAELAERAAIQAAKFGARITVPAEATGLELSGGDYVIHRADGESLRARTIIVATGVHYQRLPVPRLEEFEGSAAYYAATEMEAQMCVGDPVAVVGGGNSAGQAALFLSQHAARVHLVVRERELTENMSRYLADRIERSEIEVMLDTEVRELVGDGGELEALVVENGTTAERAEVDARRLFIFIGAEPNTDWLSSMVALDDGGYVLVGADAGGDSLLATSAPGIYAAGDVRSGSVKRVASAVGEGSMAVRLVHEHVGEHAHDQNPAPAG
jgi:thioredoxin reductase (NADPH)